MGKREPPNSCPDKWWSINRDKYPLLAMCARFLLASTPTSVDSERTFSVSGRLYSSIRNRLTGPVAEKLLFLQVNLPRVGYKWKQLRKEEMAACKYSPTFPKNITAPEKPKETATLPETTLDDWLNSAAIECLVDIDNDYADANLGRASAPDESSESENDDKSRARPRVGRRQRQAGGDGDESTDTAPYVCIGHGWGSEDDELEY
jgi:hypothetical protein